jgi:hypothetical protein
MITTSSLRISGPVDLYQRAAPDGPHCWRITGEPWPCRKIIDSRTTGFLGAFADCFRSGSRQPVEQVIGDGFPVSVSRPRPRGRPLGRSRRLPVWARPGASVSGSSNVCSAACRRAASEGRRSMAMAMAMAAGQRGKTCWAVKTLSWSPAWISWKDSGSRDGATTATAWRRASSVRAGCVSAAHRPGVLGRHPGASFRVRSR